MSKFILSFSVCLILLASYSASAQFKKGNKVIHLGFGTNPAYFDDGAPFTGAFEYGFSRWFSAGVGFDAMVGSYHQGSVAYSYIGFCPGVRASIHLAMINVEKLDIYFGGSAGVNNFLWTVDIDPLPESFQDGSFVMGYVGARYNFVKALGAFAEVSASSAVTNHARFGISLRF